MRIYRIHVEHKKWGQNWDTKKIAAETFNEAVRKATRELTRNERIVSVELVASTE